MIPLFSIVFPYVWWISQACWLSLGSLGPSGTSLQDSSIPRPLQDLNSFGSPAQHHAAFKHMRLMKMFKSDHMLINMSCMYCTCLILFVSICNIYIYTYTCICDSHIFGLVISNQLDECWLIYSPGFTCGRLTMYYLQANQQHLVVIAAPKHLRKGDVLWPWQVRAMKQGV